MISKSDCERDRFRSEACSCRALRPTWRAGCSPPPRVRVIDIVVAAACVVLALAFRHVGARSDFTLQGAAAVASRSVSFADGSLAELSNRDAELRVEHESVERVVASLRGAARFDVVPNASRAFEVRTRDVRVRVRNALRRAGARRRADEDLRRSRQGPGRMAGRQPHARRRRKRRFSPSVADRDLTAGLASPEPELSRHAAEPPALAAKAARPDGPTTSWRDYASKGEYDKAYVELNQRGKASVRDEPADLMLAADVARLSSHPGEAVAPLRKLCDVYPGDKRAPVAAFTLGRVLLDNLGRASEAAAVFEKARVF